MRNLLLLGLMVCASPLLAAPPVTYTDYNVANLNDSGPGSLRQVLTDALAATGNPRIRFSSSISFPGAIELQSPLPIITKGTVIEGAGMNQLEITRHASISSLRIFEASSGLTLTDMTLSNGRAETGGAILSRSTLTLTNIRITNCVAKGADDFGAGAGASGRGGAIAHVSTSSVAFFMTGCEIANCQALGGSGSIGGGYGDGGGLFFDHTGSVTIEYTNINNCYAHGGSGGTMPGAPGRGGGLASVAGTNVSAFTLNSVLVQNCTAEGVAGGGGWTGAGGYGGGMYFDTDSGYIKLGVRVASSEALGGDSASAFQGGDGFGGGIYLAGANNYLVIRAEIESNTSTGGSNSITNGPSHGGGIYAAGTGTVSIQSTRIWGNTAASGAGVTVVAGALTCGSSCIDNNTGGGIVLHTPSGPHAITNCTISGNAAGTAAGPNAGGINNLGTDLTVTHSTITANSGTGIVHSSAQQTTLQATIVAANTGTGPDLSGSIFQDGGYNLIGEYGDVVFVHGVNGTIVGGTGSPVDAMLGSLQYNGGSTPTHALGASSPAIDAADPLNAPSHDQRAAPRTDGLPDIGAFEFGAVPPSSGGNGGGGGDDGSCTTGTGGLNWLLLLALLAVLGLATRVRRV
ncbi:MAG: right-handed parallel beta-helix repeat-containing protein [Planctomycetes bacterium]|nr:right-handed parallel beta-helix repeat-containing protein [Planctomycetota bacterium]